MTPPVLWLRSADGELHGLGAGDLIGRSAAAALRLAGPAVSEAHALVSARDGGVWILPLRGAVKVDGRIVPGTALRAGARIEIGSWAFVVERVSDSAQSVVGDGGTLREGRAPIRIRLGDNEAKLTCGAGPELLLVGNVAELLRLLAEAEAPVPWTSLAHHFWPARDEPRWRVRFDSMLKDLRVRLRAHGLPADLLASAGGRHRLVLREGDELVRDAESG